MIDHDEVVLSNLNRQISHLEEDISKKKVDSAKTKLRRLNRTVEIMRKTICKMYKIQKIRQSLSAIMATISSNCGNTKNENSFIFDLIQTSNFGRPQLGFDLGGML